MNLAKSPLLLLLTLLCLTTFMSACAQSEANEEKFIDSEVQSDSVQIDLENQLVDAPAPYSPSEASEVISANTFAVNYMGLGNVDFRVDGIELLSNAPEWAKSEDGAAAYMVVYLNVLNINVPEDAEFAQNGYLNIFELYSPDAPEPYSAIKPWSHMPDYLREARDANDAKGYFLFTLPAQGENQTFALCWVIDDFGVSLLKADQVYLTCTFAQNELMPLTYANITDKTA